MGTKATMVVTFLCTTLFWFSVPTVRQLIENGNGNTITESPVTKELEQPLAAENSNSRSINTDKLIASYEKRIKDLESQLKKANSAPAPAPAPATEAKQPQQSLSIVGTWAYADPQTSEERDYQLIFNAYGAFKYYNTKLGFTLSDYDYSINGSTLKIGYNTGRFALSNVNGVDYLEIAGIKDYAGKLKRLK